MIILFPALCSGELFGQSAEEIERLKDINASPQKEKYDFARSYENEYDFFFSTAFLFYKNFLSSQDGGKCSFTPSCSVYAIHAIKEQGVVVGMINFFDRFSRCNSLSPEDYPKDLKHNTLIDPVRDHHYK